MKIKVGVIFGGCSVEHEVSIISAVQAMENIDQEKYDIIPIYIAKDRTWYTGKMLLEMDVYRDFDSLKRYAKKVVLVNKDGRFYLEKTTGLFRKVVTELDLAFPIVHGKNVEDGSLQGYLDSVGIPYVGSKVLGSALGQDKVVQKQIMEICKIPTPKYCWFYDSEYLVDSEEIQKQIQSLGFPVIVKPAKLGSSIGISVAHNEAELDHAITEAIRYDNKILVEEMIPNLMEVNCSVLGNHEYQETSAIAEMLTKNSFLTYEDKYIGSGKGKLKGGKLKAPLKQGGKIATGEMRIPARLEKELEEKVRQYAIETFCALNLSGVVRIDFLIDTKAKQVYVNEPNTIPGSLSFYLWRSVGKDYASLLDEMMMIAIKEFKNENKKVSSFDSNILSTYQNGGKGLKGAKKF